MTRTITPHVNSDREYWGAVDDFSDRREIIREAISNSVDANSKNIEIDIKIMEEEKLMTIKIKDNGDGMPPSKLENNFFSLGESSKLDEIYWQKGHGTKTYICGERLVVNTTNENINTVAYMNEPLSYRPKIPKIEIEEPVTNDGSNGTEVLIENINIDSRDIDKFRFGSLKAYIKWNTAGGRTTHIWDKEHEEVQITLSVSGYKDSMITVRGNKKVKNNGKETFNNLFEWRGTSNTEGDAKGMFMYYPPESLPIPNSEHELRLAIANLGNTEKERLLSGAAFTVDERMGAYLSKDGINIEHHGAGWLTKSQDWSEWIVLADTNGWALTQNRGSIRKDSFYDEVVKIIKKQFRLKLNPPSESKNTLNDSQTSLFGNSDKNKNKSKSKKIDFGNLPISGKQKSDKVGEQSGKFAGKKNQKPKEKNVDTESFMRLKKQRKNFEKVEKEFSKNVKNLSQLIESIAPNLIEPNEDGKIMFSNSPGGLVRKCESLQKDLNIEVEFAYPIFSKNNKSIPWIGSINRNSKSIKAVFHNHLEELMKELPMIEKGMIIIVEKGYKIKSTEFKVKHGALDYGTCEISDDKRYALFKPIVSDKEIVKVELLFI